MSSPGGREDRGCFRVSTLEALLTVGHKQVLISNKKKFTENFGMTFTKKGHAEVPDLPGRKLIDIPANHMHLCTWTIHIPTHFTMHTHFITCAHRITSCTHHNSTWPHLPYLHHLHHNSTWPHLPHLHHNFETEFFGTYTCSQYKLANTHNLASILI